MYVFYSYMPQISCMCTHRISYVFLFPNFLLLLRYHQYLCIYTYVSSYTHIVPAPSGMRLSAFEVHITRANDINLMCTLFRIIRNVFVIYNRIILEFQAPCHVSVGRSCRIQTAGTCVVLDQNTHFVVASRLSSYSM